MQFGKTKQGGPKRVQSFEKRFLQRGEKSHRESIEKKRALIELAHSLKDSEDFGAAASALKKAQADWKKTGYVPKKEGDKLWEEFRGACNHFSTE